MAIKYDGIDNNFVTTLNGSVTDSTTVINLHSTPSNATKGYLTIDADDSALAEHIYFKSKGSGFVTCPATGGRGVGGSTAQAHDDGATVKMYILGEHLTEIIDNMGGDASTTTKGIIEIATKAEAEAGTDTERAVTPEGAKAVAVQEAENEVNDQTGWEEKTTVIPTRASADDPTYVLTFAGVDLTDKVSLGMKIKWTQNSTVRYGFVTKISFSTNTTLTLYGGTDYNVEDTSTHAISDVYFSHQKAPLDFPLSEEKWSVEITLVGETKTSGLTSGQYYNLGSNSIVLPIGIWDVILPTFIFAVGFSGGSWQGSNFALSTSNNSASDSKFETQGEYTSGTSVYLQGTFSNIYHNIVTTSKTTYYLIEKGKTSNGGTLTRLQITSTNKMFARIQYL